MPSEFLRTKQNFSVRTQTHTFPSQSIAPRKAPPLLFIWTLSTPASLCVKMRAGIQKTCTDGASSLSAAPSPPSHSFKSSTGLRHRGSWVFPPSHQLMLPLPSSPCPPAPVLGKAGARRQAVLFLQRIDLTLPRLCFGWQKRPLRCSFF